MDNKKIEKTVWRLEDQEWWIKYSEQVRSGKIESTQTAYHTNTEYWGTSEQTTGSGSSGSGSYTFRSSGSGSYLPGNLYGGSGGYYVRSSNMSTDHHEGSDEELINKGVMAYGIHLI